MTHLSTAQALHPYLNKYGLIPLDHQEDFIPALPPVTSNDQVEFSGQNGWSQWCLPISYSTVTIQILRLWCGLHYCNS